MEKKICRMLWLMALQAAQYHQRSAIRLARIKAATCCVKSVQVARMVFLTHLGMQFMFVLLTGGLVILHVALFYGLPWPLSQRALFMGILGAVYIIVPVSILLFFSRERFWMRVTGAEKMVKSAIKEDSLCENRKSRRK